MGGNKLSHSKVDSSSSSSSSSSPSSPSSPSPLSPEQNKKTTTKSTGSTAVLYHHAFLSILSLIYFQAFVSYYLQYPGLNSTFGVEPVNMKNINIFGAEIFPNSSSQKSDNLNEMVDMIKLNTMEMDVDTFCEMVAFVGGLLSLVCAR
eukprot:5997480-Ditylum_brightwellii.AAC.1